MQCTNLVATVCICDAQDCVKTLSSTLNLIQVNHRNATIQGTYSLSSLIQDRPSLLSQWIHTAFP